MSTLIPTMSLRFLETRGLRTGKPRRVLQQGFRSPSSNSMVWIDVPLVSMLDGAVPTYEEAEDAEINRLAREYPGS